jgi:predicted glycosyltransferase
MVPGIHNLSTVGSSPLKRGVKKLADNQRDFHYINGGTAAGALSSKVNIKKVILPAMDREQKQGHATSHEQFASVTPTQNPRSR